MKEASSIDSYQTTPPCTECAYYERCKTNFERTAKAAGTSIKNVEVIMSLGEGVCDEFERRGS